MAGERILIVAPSWVGDSILSEPLVALLRDPYEDPIVDVLVAPWCAPVYARMRGIRRIVESPFAHGKLDIPSRKRLALELRKEGYTRAFVLPNSWKSALIPFFAGVGRRTGLVGEARYGLLNDARRLDKTRLPRLVDQFNLLAEPRGTATPEPALAPVLRAAPEQVAATLETFGLRGGRPAAALCVGAEYGPAKRWPAAHFAALAGRLAAEGHDAWLLGSARDEPIGAEVEALAPGQVTNLIGHTDLGQAIDLIAAAAAVVSNDSGLMHVAAALDRPLVALYGSSSPIATPPLAERASILSLGLACSPCFERLCPLGHFKCLNDLAPDRVWAALRVQLGVGDKQP